MEVNAVQYSAMVIQRGEGVGEAILYRALRDDLLGDIWEEYFEHRGQYEQGF